MSTFEAWPKTPRWNREVIITEKIDGTNAAIIIEENDDDIDAGNPELLASVDGSNVYAQSRKRMIYPGKTTDNYGFAAWVQENAVELVNLLGPGRHFGEWYGKGVARGYGLDHKRFALFNPFNPRWSEARGFDGHEYQVVPGLPVDAVPVLDVIEGPSAITPQHENKISCLLVDLELEGSRLVPGFDRPEGVILYHTASRQNYKILLENDELPKGVIPAHERGVLV